MLVLHILTRGTWSAMWSPVQVNRPRFPFDGSWLKGAGVFIHLIQADPTVPRTTDDWKVPPVCASLCLSDSASMLLQCCDWLHACRLHMTSRSQSRGTFAEAITTHLQ